MTSRTSGKDARSYKRFPWLLYLILGLVIFLVAFAPLIGVFAASAFANAHGCALDEGGPHPCIVGGHDYGEMLCTIFVAGWFMFFTLPAGVAAGLALFVILIVHVIVRRQRRRSLTPAS